MISSIEVKQAVVTLQLTREEFLILWAASYVFKSDAGKERVIHRQLHSDLCEIKMKMVGYI